MDTVPSAGDQHGRNPPQDLPNGPPAPAPTTQPFVTQPDPRNLA